MTYKARGYTPSGKNKRRRGKLIAVCTLAIIALLGVGAFFFWRDYTAGLEAVGGNRTETITIEQGASVKSIAAKLKSAELIRSEKTFEYYARIHKVSSYLQAGSYEISQRQNVPEIVSQLTHGKVATTYVTILPGQRLDQIRRSLINQGFTEADVDAALVPQQYDNYPAFVDKPAGTNLEGYLYPETFQRTAATTAKNIVEQSILQLQKNLTPEITAGLKSQGLTTYEGLVIASIVEKEVVSQADRAQAAQVFIKRLKSGIPLGSDVTAHYGSVLAGKGKDVTYDTPYNTRLHTGLPPTPISNVSKVSLAAVAKPANTDWLFFVSGDNGTTYFSKTVAEHEALAAKYCHKLCEE
ncbi:endolytic transglycosylase MltG [Candidatus Saccharibacteria bacterium]|nr:MAG: endolytic transglycosylase MltG [Candidatus Saccharibacteria bacterium]